MHKQTKKRINIVLLLLSLLIFASFVSAFSCDEYKGSGGKLNCTNTNDPSPIISVNYFEPDPVDITSAVLFEGLEEARTVSITQIANLKGIYYNYSVNQILLDGYYDFALSAQDYDRNHQTARMVIAVDVDDMDIWVDQPRINYIPKQNQTVAIGQSLPFDIGIQTRFPSTCRMKKYSAIQEDLEAEYLASYWHFNDGDEQETSYHRIQAVAYTAGDSDRGHIGISHPFDYTNLDAEDYAIICRQQVVGGTYKYSLERLYIGYDDTPFTFTADFDPTTVADYSLPITIGNIHSQNELLACTYDFTENQPAPLGYVNDLGQGTGQMHWTIQSLEDHRSDYSYNFSFAQQAGYFTPNQAYPYTVSFTCFNPAMWSHTTTASFTVDLKAEFTVTLDQADLYLQSASPTFTARTSSLAICYYRIDESDEWQQIGDEEFKREHTFSGKNLDTNYHEVEIRCEAVAAETSKTFGFTIDNQRPAKPILNASNYICSEQADIQILPPEPTDIVAYNYTLANMSNFRPESIETGPFLTDAYTDEGATIRSTVALIPEKDYYWRVYAIDQAGNPSAAPATKRITVKNESSIYCDRILPQVKIIVNKTAQGYAVDVTCTDAQTGCAQTYNYTYVGEGQNCNNVTSTQRHRYIDGPQLFNADGTLCYSVYDNAGNTVTGSRILSPEIEIELITPRFGISQTKNFNLEVETDKAVTCKHGFFGAQHAPDIADWYTSLPGTLSTTPSQQHQTYIVASEIDQLDDGLAETLTPWVIICKDEDIYHYINFTLGFDTTPPSLQVSAQPNPILDPGKVTTMLSVQSDDQVVCTYLDETGVPTGFANYEPADQSSYISSHSVNLSFWGTYNDAIQQNIWCMNRAQKGVEKPYTIEISLDNGVGISISSPDYYNSMKLPINVTTQHVATCEYRTSPTGTFRKLVGSQTTHNTKIDVSLGEQVIEVQCTSQSTGSTGTAFHTVIIDTQAPSLEIISPSQTCSLDEIQASILANGTGSPIASYTYEVSLGAEIIATGQQTSNTLQIPLNLTEGTKYKLSVTATDAAQNTRVVSKTLTASEYDSASCDTTPPNGDVKITPLWNDILVEVSCTDAGVGCAQSYGYQLVETSCTDSYTQQSYATQPIHFQESGTFCYKIYDQSNNFLTKSEGLEFNAHCYNEIQDNYETGVDCGGACLAQCGTCENNKIDPFELGVDCGGVCATYARCNIENNETKTKPDGPTTCDFDEDCDYYSRCENGFCESKAPSGGDCSKDTDCNQHSICVGGKCEVESTEGDTCTSNDDCDYYSDCISGVCQKRETTTDGCEYSYDCAYGEVCREGLCVLEEKGIRILGLVFIILGLLLMGGGIYYIYYTEQQKKQYAQRKRNYQEHLTQQQRAAQEAAQKKRLQDIKEKKVKGEAKRDEKVQERHGKRKDLLGSFADAVGEAQEKTTKEEHGEESSTKKSNISSEEENIKYIDEGSDEEYLDLSKPEAEEESSVFEDLEKVAKGTPEALMEITSPKEKKDAVKAKKTAAAKEENKEEDEEESTAQSKEKDKKETKKDSSAKQEEDEENEKPIDIKKKRSADTFAALEAMIQEANIQEQPHVEHLAKHTKDLGDVNTNDFVKAFTKNVAGKKLDKPTLISLLHVLLEEKKITLETTKEILEELASKNFITASDVQTLFTELS